MKIVMLVSLLLVGASATAARPAPAEPTTSKLPKGMVFGERIVGTSLIQLHIGTLERLKGKGIHRVSPVAELCIDEQGTPLTVELKRSTGDKEGDATIHDAIAEWRYRPALMDGKPVRVCFQVLLNYTIQ